MSVEKLKACQKIREALYAQITAHADVEDKSGEWNAKWEELNAAYDANMSEMESIRAEQAQDSVVKNRLEALDKSLTTITSGGSVDDHVDSDLGLGMQVANRADFAKNQVIALHGWFLNNSGQSDRIKPGHIAAAKATGINLGQNEFNIHLQPTAHFLAMQAQKQTSNQKESLLRSAMNTMQVGDGASGGFLVGQTLLRTIEQAQLDFSGVMQVAEVMRTSNGEPLIWPTMDDTGNTGSRVGEPTDAGTAADPTVGQQTWGAHTFTSGRLSVSRSLLQDAIIDLERVIGEMLGTRLGRKQNTDYTTGVGGGISPVGIVTGSTLGVTAASATAIVFDELIDLEHSIDVSRRTNAAYMFHDSILAVIRKLKDGNSNYLWTRGTDASAPDRINGWQYFTNADMQSSVATATKTVLFGQLSQYKIRQVGSIRMQRLVERAAEFDQDQFIAYLRADGQLLNAGDNPVKHLLQA